MKEARIILPVNDNDGNALTQAHETLRGALCSTFGGYTRTESFGGWVDPSSKRLYEEHGYAYDVAMVDNDRSVRYLRLLAQRIAVLARQEAVYIRHASGDVEIVPAAEEAA